MVVCRDFLGFMKASSSSGDRVVVGCEFVKMVNGGL